MRRKVKLLKFTIIIIWEYLWENSGDTKYKIIFKSLGRIRDSVLYQTIKYLEWTQIINRVEFFIINQEKLAFSFLICEIKLCLNYYILFTLYVYVGACVWEQKIWATLGENAVTNVREEDY